MTVELAISLIGVLATGVFGACGYVVKRWLESIDKNSSKLDQNTMQVVLLNQKLEYFVEELEALRGDVDALLLWKASTQEKWK